MDTARALAGGGRTDVFRAGLWKPRTRPHCFEGVGDRGLPWLTRAGRESSLPTATEAVGAKQVEACLKHGIDVLWMGARTTANPFSVREIVGALRGTNVPLLIKNPVHGDVFLWMGAVERALAAGLKKIAAVHRGFFDFRKHPYRNRPLWEVPLALRREFPGLPVLCDPSHIAGRRDLVADVCREALCLNMDGLMVEAHIAPDTALSDPLQQVTPRELGGILDEATSGVPPEGEIERLRSGINRIDDDIVESLALRMEAVERIGAAKRDAGIEPLQRERREALFRGVAKAAADRGLPEDYVQDLYGRIHRESLKRQEAADAR